MDRSYNCPEILLSLRPPLYKPDAFKWDSTKDIERGHSPNQIFWRNKFAKQ